MDARPSVALVIPAWDEADAIGHVLDEVPRDCVQAVFVVVGGPNDPTIDVARAHGAEVVVPSKRGYGEACWTGARAAHARGADIVAFLDGDYADAPACLPDVLRPLCAGTADLVLGCRDLSRARDALPMHAQLGNRLVLTAIWLLTGAHLRDLPSYKAIRLPALADLDMRERSYGWTVEMLVKAARANLRIAQISTPYRHRRGGRSKVAGNAAASARAAVALIRCTLSCARWQPERLSRARSYVA